MTRHVLHIEIDVDDLGDLKRTNIIYGKNGSTMSVDCRAETLKAEEALAALEDSLATFVLRLKGKDQPL